MLKMAGSIDRVMPLEYVPEGAQEFFNCKTVGLADQELNSQFHALMIYDAGFAQGFTQSLHCHAPMPFLTNHRHTMQSTGQQSTHWISTSHIKLGTKIPSRVNSNSKRPHEP